MTTITHPVVLRGTIYKKLYKGKDVILFRVMTDKKVHEKVFTIGKKNGDEASCRKLAKDYQYNYSKSLPLGNIQIKPKHVQYSYCRDGKRVFHKSFAYGADKTVDQALTEAKLFQKNIYQ